MLARISLSASSLLGAACPPARGARARLGGDDAALPRCREREIRAVSGAADWRAEAIDRLDPLERALIAGFRLVRDPVLPHARSVFHCVTTPWIPVDHARELPIGRKLPSYFLLKSLPQSFPLEWRDVLRYQRVRKLHTPHSAPLLTLRGHSVQRRQLIATWSMGVPVLTAMYSRAIGSTSRGKRACVSPPSLGMWTIHQPPSRVTSISKLDIGPSLTRRSGGLHLRARDRPRAGSME